MTMSKMEQLRGILLELDDVVVAFSGGVDSTFLLKVALDTLGKEKVLAVTADSETYPSTELEEAKRLAQELGVTHRVVETSELNIPGYSENTPNRCYFCKKNLFEVLLPIVQQRGGGGIIYGLIADDMNEHRPGVQAAKELGVRGPLQEAGWTKAEIRDASRELGLSTWEKPSFACLSSRVAYGEQITGDKLNRIELAEAYLRSLGFKQVRVRVHGVIARIEVYPEEIGALLERNQEIGSRLVSYGFQYVTADLLGYQSGSMNRGLNKEAERLVK
ncbi:ATP-dependent sacrificial sulfur transferase LarE [Paenibacillus abyssi]|uniref:7-cyano-7-deazaguanine synthase n=1 Tax=Paenibacillus abyssi TaxID=1340531 RepID=A0A917CSK8_9BACL|nr:ATP-dependent sacrificial sulfur transferase LarE [Paenibacillus abyssi]GGF96372.1 7-cyano-7-deazaguanine synthase [Paenibacillus abyssi]